MVDEIITFDFIFECWKNKNYPDGFDDSLEKYLKIKIEIFTDDVKYNLKLSNPTRWLSNIIIAIEIGLFRNEKRFSWYRKYWENLLGKTWKVSIEDKWVSWV